MDEKIVNTPSKEPLWLLFPVIEVTSLLLKL